MGVKLLAYAYWCLLLQASASSKRSSKMTSSNVHLSGPPASAPGPWELPPVYPAYGMAPLPSIPPGYALVAPNLLLPLDALQARPCFLHECTAWYSLARHLRHCWKNVHLSCGS